MGDFKYEEVIEKIVLNEGLSNQRYVSRIRIVGSFKDWYGQHYYEAVTVGTADQKGHAKAELDRRLTIRQRVVECTIELNAAARRCG